MVTLVSRPRPLSFFHLSLPAPQQAVADEDSEEGALVLEDIRLVCRRAQVTSRWKAFQLANQSWLPEAALPSHVAGSSLKLLTKRKRASPEPEEQVDELAGEDKSDSASEYASSVEVVPPVCFLCSLPL